MNQITYAPHTLAMLTADTWLLPYSRKGSLSTRYVDNKFWPSVRRVDETYDRNLICSCAPIEAYVTPIVTDHSKMPRVYRGIFHYY
jgi:glycine dehydrogenase